MKKLTLFLTILLCGWSFAQAQRTVSGKVTDQNGQPLIGANVFVKGTTSGTVADAYGRYEVNVPAGATVIIFSYTGYESREMAIGASNVLDVVMTEGVVLEAAVVTALGIRRDEKSLGYAVAQVDGDDVSRVRDPNIVNQLAGRAAGVTVIGSSGNLGGSARITIRGIKSINGNNQPLFVVDGVPMDNSNFTDQQQAVGGGNGVNPYDYGNAIQDINPNDIENISVLKGQAAAALYGSRGANGVIMITTKKGAKARKGLGVTVNSSLTFDRLFVFPKFQNKYGGGVDLLPQGYDDNSGYYDVPISDGTTTWQSFDLVPIYAVDESNGVRFATSTDQHFQHLVDGWGYSFPDGFGSNQPNLYYRNWNSWDEWDTRHFGKNVLWEAGDDPREFFETGVTSSQNIAVEGGGDKATFRLSYSRLDQTGIIPNSKMERNNIGFNGSLDLNDHFQAFLGVNYVNSNTKGRSGSGYDNRGGINPAFNFSQWWHTQLRFDELKSYENPDGTMRTWNRISADNPRPNYWDNPYWARHKNFQTDGRNRVFGNVGVTWKINSWLNLTGRVLTDFYNEFREDRNSVGSILTSFYTRDLLDVNETNADLILRADKNIGENLSLGAFVGGNKRWSKVKRDFGSTVGGLSVPDIYRVQNSRERPTVLNTLTEKQIESLFGGLTLGWKNLFYLDLTGRQDWSSALPDDNNGYFYPSASASFVFSELFTIPTLSFGKLRFGWAQVGNDTDPYNIYTVYQPNQNFGSNPSVTVPNTLNNDRLRPEKTSTIEGGFDIRFFQNRIGLDLTLYSGKTTDQIIPLATTPTSGYSNQFINAGEITNKGIEISLHLIPVKTQHFSWDMDFNFGKNKNEVVSILPEDPSIVSLPLAFAIFGGASINAYIGQPYGTILGTNYLYDKSGNKLVDPNSGFYLFSSGQMPIGNIVPDFTGGVTNSLSWKGLSFSVFVDFRKGGDIISTTNMWGRYSGMFEETAKGDERENGVLNDGVFAVVDGDGLPVQDGGQDTETLLDDTYQSTGNTNDMKVNYQAHNFLDGGYVINAADVYDGSFIKLREISLGYTLPKNCLNKAGMMDVTISVVGRNLAYLLKNVPHIDPDQAISTSNIQGLEGATTPSTRSFGINLNLKF